MLTNPIHIKTIDIGHGETKVVFFRSYMDNPDELREYASNYILNYWDKLGGEQHGSFDKNCNFVYFHLKG